MTKEIMKVYRYSIQLTDDREVNVRDTVTTVTGSVIALDEVKAIDVACKDAINEFKKKKKIINYKFDEI